MPNPRILLTNDDGINAEGLAALERIARTLSDDIWVVAPELEQSGASHSLSLHEPVRVRKVSEKRYATSGTPTDCVLLALQQIIPEALKGMRSADRMSHQPAGDTPSGSQKTSTGVVDLVLSGINRGSNAGDDITYSGTVAGAMEGTVLGVPSIALSLLGSDREKALWPTAEHFAPELLKKLIATGWPKDTFININFPECDVKAVKGLRVCPMGKRIVSVALTERVDPKGRPYFWIGGEREHKSEKPGVDVELLHDGYITVTPLGLDLTDYKTLEKLNQAVGR